MTQRDRDRLVVLKKAHKKLITQRQAAEELGLTERHVRRMLARLSGRTTSTEERRECSQSPLMEASRRNLQDL
jgi:DNA-binding Lrp family transcriptional regulator